MCAFPLPTAVLIQGNGIAIMGSGDLGSNSATGGVNLYVDQGSSHPGNYSTFGSAGNDSTSALGRIRVPAGSHTASFGVNGEEGLNLLFGGFEISDGMTNIQRVFLPPHDIDQC